MKTQNPIRVRRAADQGARSGLRRPLRAASSRGFTLVITISMMVLLTVISVGLLALSAITLRSTAGEEAASVARQQARLALTLALGELQKTAGPDRAITAPASLLAEESPHGVTGVWEPWDAGMIEGRGSAEKTSRFRQWLVSTADGRPSSASAPPLATPGAANSALLLGEGSLRNRAAVRADEQRIALPLTRLRAGGMPGSYAWAVIDEGVKARADLAERDFGSSPATNALLRAGAPSTDGIQALAGLASLRPGERDHGRFLTIGNTNLADGLDRDALSAFHPDLSVHSTSLLTDPVRGGLKHDLSLRFSTAQNQIGNARLYDSAGLPSGPSDPLVSMLAAYHNLYQQVGQRVGTSTPPPGGLVARLPARYTPTRYDPRTASESANPVTPAEPLLLPTVVRVDTIFSLITRDVHGGRSANLRSNGRPYLLHLLYLPVVTLHNPYNVPLSFDGLRVTFRNLPVGFQFLVDGQPMTTTLVPLNQLYVGSEGNPNATKDFSINLRRAFGSGAGGAVVLEPGQTKLFGTPRVPPTWRWADESPGAGADGVALFDWRNDKTTNFEMIPRLMTPPTTGAGFDVDWLAPRGLQTEVARSQHAFGEGIIALRGTERVGVNYGPFAPGAAGGSFSIDVELQSSGRFAKAGSLGFRYQNAARLTDIVEQGTSLRFPQARSFPETFPKSPGDPALRATDFYEGNNTAIRDYIRPRPFMIFSVAAPTTMESFLPNRAMADGSPVYNLARVDLASGGDPVGGSPLEVVMMPIRNGNAAIEEQRETEEAFFFSGNGSLRGTSRATIYEVPLAPPQSLAQFRHANLAGSGFMPRVTYTVGESRAHPQIGTEGVTGTWTDRSAMLDHTWLANEALWDRYFLSTIAPLAGPRFTADGRAAEQVMEDFFRSGRALPNPRFRPHRPATEEVPEAVSGPDGWTKVAASLLLDGGFNVNSASEEAWIAVLSSLREADLDTALGLDAAADGHSAFPRVRQPSARSIDDAPFLTREQRWQGYRRLSDENLRVLAREIVREVRERGPFLSLAEFVNRGLGPDNDPRNLSGAIQAAIDRSNLNALAAADGIPLEEDHLSFHGYQSDAAGAGNSAEGSPGHLSQGDVLSVIGSRVAVRSDTFRIRAYGEARDSTGNRVLARAWCEAVVQRVPDFVDPTDASDSAIDALRPVNLRFGRRFEVIHFRWLGPDEV